MTELLRPGENLVFVRVNNLWDSRQAPRAGEHVFNGGIYRIRHILQERGSRIRIESSPEVGVEVDGEPLGHTPLEFSILHKAIRIVVAKEFYEQHVPAEDSARKAG